MDDLKNAVVEVTSEAIYDEMPGKRGFEENVRPRLDQMAIADRGRPVEQIVSKVKALLDAGGIDVSPESLRAISVDIAAGQAPTVRFEKLSEGDPGSPAPS